MKKTIFYGLVGEGLGHACRTQAILEHLDPSYQVHLFTWGEAYDFFNKQNYPHLHRIVGLPFSRKRNGCIDLIMTGGIFCRLLFQMPSNIRYVIAQADKYKPDLFISDFDPVIARAARKYGKPLISIDNQHKFSRTNCSDLPLDLRLYTLFMGFYSEWTCSPDFAVVSTFYHSAVRKKHCNKTALVNCFMRYGIREITPTSGDYILVYYKPSVGPKMLELLGQTKEKLIVYNCPPEARTVQADYRPINNDVFIKDLAGCKALFSSAGNQLLGEAVYFNKPAFVVPEPNQPEQRVNAYYLAEMGNGMTCSLLALNAKVVTNFINNFKPPSRRGPSNGVYEAVKYIKFFVEQNSRTRRR